MICPHCKKPIKRGRWNATSVPDDVKKKALALFEKGYSMRDIEFMLERQISAATISRLVRAQGEEK